MKTTPDPRDWQSYAARAAGKDAIQTKSDSTMNEEAMKEATKIAAKLLAQAIEHLNIAIEDGHKPHYRISLLYSAEHLIREAEEAINVAHVELCE